MNFALNPKHQEAFPVILDELSKNNPQKVLRHRVENSLCSLSRRRLISLHPKLPVHVSTLRDNAVTFSRDGFVCWVGG